MLAVADLFAVGLAVCSVGLTLASSFISLGSLLALPVCVVAAKMMGLYDRDELVLHKTTLNEAPSVLHLSTLVTLVVVFAQAALETDPPGFIALFAFWAVLFTGTLTCRTLARRLARTATPAERCVLVGDVSYAARIKRLLDCQPSLNAKLVALIPFNRVTARGEDAETFGDYLARSDFHRVIVTHTDHGFHEMLETIRLFKSKGIKVSVLPGLFEVLGSAVEFDDISGSTLLGVRSYGLSRSSLALKRSMDALLSGAGLLLLSPFMAVIALAIKIDTRGPVFFRQTRIGRKGDSFQILKFRSMAMDAEDRKPDLFELEALREEGLFKIEDDPRVTRVGRLLRGASLDELPQLFNVLRGDMSLVGPRPLIIDEDSQVIGWQRGRLDLTPGMTGVWQVLPFTRLPLEDMVALDYLYIVNWSLWSDVQILMRTIPHVLGRRGL